MTIKLHESKVKSIRAGDRRFMIQDGFASYPRAMLHVLPECPIEYSLIIQKCFNNGWIKPVAHVTERELLFMGLADEQTK
jgi:hypothetical protein